jgi:hypothetical protein
MTRCQDVLVRYRPLGEGSGLNDSTTCVEAEPFACAQSVNLTTMDQLVEKLAIEQITYLRYGLVTWQSHNLCGG